MNVNNLKYFWDYLTDKPSEFFNQIYFQELTAIITSNTDVSQSETLKVAREKLQTMLNCKNFFKARVLERIIFDLIVSDEQEFESIKKETWGKVIERDVSKYFDIENGRLRSYKCNWKCVPIPNGITKIEDNCFEGNSFIREVIFTDGLKEIGKYAFSGCEFIESITFGEGLNKVGEYAFWEASGLSDAVLPETLSIIEEGAFCHSDIRSVKIGGVKTISKRAFCESSLVSAVILQSVETIEEYAFGDCYYLDEVTFVGKRKNIHPNAFKNCENITKIKFIGTYDELEEIKKDLYLDAKCFKFAVGHSGELACIRKEKQMKGFSSLSLDNVEVIFEITNE